MSKMILAAVLTAALPAGAATFRPEAIRAHMNFLASDLLEGRGTGTRGYQLAAAYVAAQFEAAGIQPGVNGSFFQPIRFRRTMARPDSTITLVPDRGAPVTLRFGEGFVTFGDPLAADRALEGRVVVVGHGITAPELKHDDYAGSDVRGKIVAYFSGAPVTFPNTLRAHYSSSLGKLENAAAHGAIGVLTLTTREDAERAPWARNVRNYKLGTMHWLESNGHPHAVIPQISHSASLSMDAQQSLFAGSGHTFDRVSSEVTGGRSRPLELPLRASIRMHSSHELVESSNVIGVLSGSDAKLGHEYLVYSSHLDHLGISDPVDGDAINNGALDNASGIAAMIEIARAFAMMPTPPRRSIIFLATTAEEKGLKGADYFANNPTIPIDQVVGNINVDQIMMLHALKDIVALGEEVSDLGLAARKVAAEMGLEISPDPYPEEVYFVRSDQYPFVKRGVPAIFVGMGYKAIDARIDSAKEQMKWIKTRYHTPKDDLEQNLDYSVGATLARFNYRLGLEVANRTRPPAWTPGNFFGQKFGRRSATRQ